MTEKELQESGNWKRETMTFHIAEIDPNSPYGVRRLSYDIGYDYTNEQIGTIKAFFNEVNARFPNIKIIATGTSWIEAKNEEPKTEEV